MKSVLQEIIKKNKQREQEAAAVRQAEIDSPTTPDNRRRFLKKTALGGMALTSLCETCGLPIAWPTTMAGSETRRIEMIVAAE